MKTMRMVCVLATLSIPVSVLAAEAPLADRLPASAMAYVGWADSQSEDFRGSVFGQLLQEPAVQKIWGTLQQAASQNTGGQSDLAFVLGEFLAKHPVAAALTELQINDDGPEKLSLKAVLVVDLGKDKAQFVEALDQVFDRTGLANHCSEVKIGGKTFMTIQPQENIAFTWGYDGNLFIVGINGG